MLSAPYLPAAQLTQVSIEAAPSSVEYLPLTHSAHDVEAVASAYVPAAQLTQAALDSAPSTFEYLPASHREHVSGVVAPELAEYLPASHLTQFAS